MDGRLLLRTRGLRGLREFRAAAPMLGLILLVSAAGLGHGEEPPGAAAVSGDAAAASESRGTRGAANRDLGGTAASPAHATPGDSAELSAGAWLSRWSRISEQFEPVDVDQYVARYEGQYPQEVLAAMAGLLGPVEDAGLERAFRWSVVAANDEEVRLRGLPRGLERLAARPPANEPAATGRSETRGLADGAAQWYGFEVVLDRLTARPRQVRWLNSSTQAPREAVAQLPPSDLEIVLAGGFDETSWDAGLHGRVTPASALQDDRRRPGADAGVGRPHPRLQEILARWEQAAAEIQSAELTFQRFDFDSLFEIEQRGQGRFIFVAPAKGLYELRPAPVVEPAEGGRTSVLGGRFTVTPAKPQTIYWSSDTVTVIDFTSRTYDILPLPRRPSQAAPAGSWDVIWHVLAGPQKSIPGVFGLTAAGFFDVYDWSLIEESEEKLLLEGRPRNASDRRHRSRIDVVLDPRTFRTTATRTVDPSGARETLHVFEYELVNSPQTADEARWRPEMSQFDEAGPPPLAPAVEPEQGVAAAEDQALDDPAAEDAALDVSPVPEQEPAPADADLAPPAPPGVDGAPPAGDAAPVRVGTLN